ncbi:MAG: hypothetical protein WC728_00110 [Elusimicrobiota bacterium]
MKLLLFALLAAAQSASALDAADIPSVRGGAIRTKDDELAEQVRDRLISEPEAADAVAGRICRSTLGPQLSGLDDPRAAFGEVRGWVGKNPEPAAYLALGFAKDDAEGTDEFERSLYERIVRYFELNPGRHHGMLGKLDRLAVESKQLALSEEFNEDSQREALRRFFEGAEGEATRPDGKEHRQGGEPPPTSDGPAAYAGGHLYDRLGSANPTGYSPHVLTFQSEMNRRRAPGAPKLLETGRLDYATLRYPYYGMRYDADRLARSLRTQRAWSQAKALGRERSVSLEKLKDPAVQAELDAAFGGRDPDPRFTARKRLLAKLEQVLSRFDQEAASAKNKKKIDSALLRSLSAGRREAALLIAAAAHEERLHVLRSCRGFMTDALRAAVARMPVDPETRSRYLGKGERMQAELDSVVAQGETLSADLAASKPPADAEKTLARTAQAARRFPADIAAYREAPARVLETHKPVSRVRGVFDSFFMKFLPGSKRSRALREQRKREDGALSAVLRIAGNR